MVSKKTDLSHKQEGINSGRREGGEEEEEKGGALACRYASTQSPPLTSARGDSKLHSYIYLHGGYQIQISPLSSGNTTYSSRCSTGINCEMKKMK